MSMEMSKKRLTEIRKPLKPFIYKFKILQLFSWVVIHVLFYIYIDLFK